MTVSIPEDLNRYASMGILSKLLADHSAKGNIVWATTAYEHLGEGYTPVDEIQAELVTDNHSGIIRRRARKDREEQNLLTRKHAEVFTPASICSMMIDYADYAWMENLGIQRIEDFWQEYISSQRMEITCGEAPYLTNRYDAETGEEVSGVETRIGILDRKLQTVSSSVHQRQDWIQWAIKATESTYGYEYQGDNLLIARINILRTVEDHLSATGFEDMSKAEYEQFANIISWNLWQMDGLTLETPARKGDNESEPLMLFDFESSNNNETSDTVKETAKIRNWVTGRAVLFKTLLAKRKRRAMKFDYIIGNPPYQEENGNNGRQPPIYHLFMDGAYECSDVVELITPARFLSEAGQTPKAWNQKMLADPHLKVLEYYPNSRDVFANADIKGGVVITLHDTKKTFSPIGVFTQYEELHSILNKIGECETLDTLASPRGLYRLSNEYFLEYPEIKGQIGNGSSNMLVSKYFDIGAQAFEMDPSKDSIKVYGIKDKKRTFRYIDNKYIINNEYLSSYNLLVAEGNGNGDYGEALSDLMIAKPKEGTLDSFVSIGKFKTEAEAVALSKYVSTKFARSLLGIRKVTQHTPKAVWSLIPLQDFTPSSDIDWSRSIPEIDAQLYAKYGLDEHEIEFIETHVKEMD